MTSGADPSDVGAAQPAAIPAAPIPATSTPSAPTPASSAAAEITIQPPPVHIQRGLGERGTWVTEHELDRIKTKIDRCRPRLHWEAAGWTLVGAGVASGVGIGLDSSVWTDVRVLVTLAVVATGLVVGGLALVAITWVRLREIGGEGGRIDEAIGEVDELKHRMQPP